jgi:UDP-3-O-acyl-N-acetylglucosamine deacetylase
MWKYDPKMIPQKYWDIAMKYMNEIYTTRTFGICNDIGYVCNPGQTRRDCDPCAVPSARKYAQNIHLNDMIIENCSEK